MVKFQNAVQIVNGKNSNNKQYQYRMFAIFSFRRFYVGLASIPKNNRRQIDVKPKKWKSLTVYYHFLKCLFRIILIFWIFDVVYQYLNIRIICLKTINLRSKRTKHFYLQEIALNQSCNFYKFYEKFFIIDCHKINFFFFRRKNFYGK